MTTIDWSKAGDSARETFDRAMQAAAGDIVTAIDDLVADASVPRQVKLGIMQQLGNALGNREQLQKLLSGKPTGGTTPTPALPGGTTTSDDPDLDDKIRDLEQKLESAKQELGDTQDKLATANTVNDVHKSNTQVLKAVVGSLPTSTRVTMPADSSTPFDSDTPQRVKRAIEEEVKKAKNEGRAEASGFDQAKAYQALTELTAAIDDLSTKRLSPEVDGRNKVLEKAKKLANTVGIKPPPSSS